jgi:hypothetical protein
MGIIDKAKAFAHVGVSKAGKAASDTAVKGAHLAADVASKGAAKANEAAGQLRDAKKGRDDQPSGPQDGGSTR